MPRPPLIAVTCDTRAAHERDRADHWRYESHSTYADAIVVAGGVPVLLPFAGTCIERYVEMCDGFLLSGGDDPDTQPFGEAVHPEAKILHPARQRFEIELLAALSGSHKPVLGVCLGMQWMALCAGGHLHQHLPDAPGIDDATAAAHMASPHTIEITATDHPYLVPGVVHSRHHQAVANPGTLRIAARADDGVIEAIDDPTRNRFYLGVQWHPERTEDEALGLGLIRKFVDACKTGR